MCKISTSTLEVSETLNPDVAWTSRRVVVLDTAGNGFAYDTSLETTLKDGTVVIDNVELVS